MGAATRTSCLWSALAAVVATPTLAAARVTSAGAELVSAAADAAMPSSLAWFAAEMNPAETDATAVACRVSSVCAPCACTWSARATDVLAPVAFAVLIVAGAAGAASA